MPTPIDRVQSGDMRPGDIAHRVPEAGMAQVTWGATATVPDHAAAVFFRSGKVLEVLGPGRHVLSATHFPQLAPENGSSPATVFPAAIYFVNQRVLEGMRWSRPALFRDPELGAVELRASGVYALRVSDPGRFILNLAGSEDKLSATYLDAYLEEIIVARFDDLLSKRLPSLLELPALHNELATEARLELREDFIHHGVDLIDFFLMRVEPVANPRATMKIGKKTVRPRRQKTESGSTRKKKTKASVPTATGTGVGSGMSLVLPQAFVGQQVGCPTCREGSERSCQTCHQWVPPRASFCPSCGSPLRKS